MANGRIDIERYISGADGADPICREERQYALFLNNILLGIKAGKITGDDRKDILSACGLEGAEIDDVFYEAAFMRDIFFYAAAKKKCFNVGLLKYVLKHVASWKQADPEQFKVDQDVDIDLAHTWRINEENVRPVDLGGRAGPEVFEALSADIRKPELRVIQSAVRAMMKIKPDLALIYRKGGKRYLNFIECKLESTPSTYIYRYDDGPVGSIKVTLNQLDVQNWVVHFLCDEEHGPLRDLHVEGNASRRVQFSQDSNEKGAIPISTLIELHKELFK